jgi:hypothetical protein
VPPTGTKDMTRDIQWDNYQRAPGYFMSDRIDDNINNKNICYYIQNIKNKPVECQPIFK